MSGEADLDACAREPIHRPGSIQPHGILLAVDDDGRIAAASANAAPLVGDPAAAIGRPVAACAPRLHAVLGPRLRGAPGADAWTTILREIVLEPGTPSAVTVHRSGDVTLVEVEPESPGVSAVDGPAAPDDDLGTLDGLIRGLGPTVSDADAYAATAAVIRRTTGFDRVLVYAFDESFVGTVVGEDRNDVLPSYLDLRFPASDIPAQARELYRVNRIRQIPDAGYTPVPILARPDLGPIDLGRSVLRSVSPVHVEYMRNMGTGASMSVSILVDGRLWGLVACHARDPRRVPSMQRRTCDLVARLLALRIAAHERQRAAADGMALQGAVTRLLAAMAEAPSYAAGLSAAGGDLLAATRASGAVLVDEGGLHPVGDVPGEDDVRRIVAWLDGRADEEVTATDRLPQLLPAVAGAADRASGLLAVQLSRIHSTWLLWFRPEVVRTVTWGGDPAKQFEPIGPATRISPRKSFAAWSETVRRTAPPWSPAEIEAARSLRSAIVDIVLRKAEEVAAVSEDLRRTNRELEAFSYSISHDLRAPFRHIVGYAELLAEREGATLDEKSRHYLRNIIEAAHGAGKLVDDLLHFSQMGRVTIQHVGVDMAKIAAEVRRSTLLDVGERRVDWQVSDLPSCVGDPSLLRQVLYNLVHNAVKYSRNADPAVIEIGGWAGETETTYYVRDNGIGFDMAYADKLFQVFQRLNRTEDFEGTGIGLALVRRVVERHGGRTWAAGQLGRGATFYFAVPTVRDAAKPGAS